MCISRCKPPTTSLGLPVHKSALSHPPAKSLLPLLSFLLLPRQLFLFTSIHKIELAAFCRLPGTSGVFTSLNNVRVGSNRRQGWVYKMYKHTSLTGVQCRKKSPFLLLLLSLIPGSHFAEWHQVTYGEPVECGSSWHGVAICWGGKNGVGARGGCLFGLVGVTASPVKAVRQLSAVEQTETHLHLISPTSPTCTSGRVGLFLPLRPPPSSASLNARSLSCSCCRDPSSVWDKAFCSHCPRRVTDGHVLPLFSGLECLIKKAWPGPLMSVWIKNTVWLLGRFPHFNWKPNVNPAAY